MSAGIAIIIPALDEADNIGDLLDDCRAQLHQPAEVVVVDAGSRDGTYEIARAYAEKWPRLQVLRVAGATPGAGRNAAIAASVSPLLVTVDCGSRVDPDWLNKLSSPMRGDPERPVICVGRAIPEAETPFERASGWLSLNAFKPPGGRRPTGADYLPGAGHGTCFSRTAWQRVGGYPEELPWGEDKIFLRRLRAAGIELLAVPDAQVRWRPRRSLGEVWRMYRDYGRADALLGLEVGNELVTLAIYATGAALAVAAVAGVRVAAPLLGFAALAYLGLYTAFARRDLGWSRALAWVGPVRLAADLGKIQGFLGGLWSRLARA